ncbi:Vps52 Sac2 family protein, putative [Babesia ovata]|uniref:Vps52 Sac2 family protein, putative n=1 Tax=Babesia ovata TaxID=189622 RepID=A0A2H6K963_9APIC|nr:Vps52 Sac2 family protein, putative [Babesia ovata]GBE59534.1 Vps52 Sac2 family protein, putative [Babesia ovata]
MRDHHHTQLLDIAPDAFAEDLKWLLGGVDAPHSLEDLEPWRNAIVKRYFEPADEQEPSQPGPAIVDVQNEAEEESEVEFRVITQLNSIISRVDLARQQWQDEVTEAFLAHEEEISEFSTDMNYCDSTIKLIEEALTKHYKSLEAASTYIKNLHTESSALSACLDNRQAFLKAVQGYLDDIAVSPSLIRAICHEPIGEPYVKLLEQFQAKVHKMKTLYEGAPYPSLHPSKIQMKKLELVIVGRIYDFLRLEIAKLATPKANLQMIQNTNFLRLRPLFAYIRDTNANYANEIKSQYAKTLRKIYCHLFSSYYAALERCRRKNRYKDIGVFMKRSTKTPAGYFLLDDRDQLVINFKDDPIVPTGLELESLGFEDIFKSFLKLLVDTAFSEYVFISQFFEQGVTNMFTYIFDETMLHLRARVETLIKSSYDPVMLITLTLLFAANRHVMQHRGVTLLDETLGKLQNDLYSRAMHHLKNMAKHVMSCTLQASSSTLDTWLPGAHAINLSNLVYAALRLKGTQDKLGIAPIAFDSLDHLIHVTVSALTLRGRKLSNTTKLNVFVIANCVAFLHPLQEFKDSVVEFEPPLNKHIESYVSSYVGMELENIINLVTSLKESLESKSEKGGRITSAEVETESQDPDDTEKIDDDTVAKWRTAADEFVQSSRDKFKAITSKVELHFAQEAAVERVNDAVLKSIEDIYSEFYTNLASVINTGDRSWLESLPQSTDVIEWLKTSHT